MQRTKVGLHPVSLIGCHYCRHGQHEATISIPGYMHCFPIVWGHIFIEKFLKIQTFDIFVLTAKTKGACATEYHIAIKKVDHEAQFVQRYTIK